MKQKRKVDKDLIKQINQGRCLVCSALNPDAHHVKSKKSGGDDVASNLMPLCRVHHTEVHKIGLNRFVDKYPNVKGWLLSNNWEFNQLTMKWYQVKGGAWD